MSSSYRLRVRCAQVNNAPVIDFLLPATTLENLHQVLSATTEIPEDQLKILIGYPPKMVQGSRECQLQSLGVQNGDMLIIERRSATDPLQYYSVPQQTVAAALPQAKTENTRDTVQETLTPTGDSSTIARKRSRESKEDDNAELHSREAVGDVPPVRTVKRSAIGNIKEDLTYPGNVLSPGSEYGVLLKMEVPADNSCLFASMDYLLNGSINRERVQQLRVMVSTNILLATELVPDFLLEKSREDYSTWILQPNSWGGAVELALLSDHYAIEIVALDARTALTNRFGETKGYKVRIVMLYDGIHYDPVHMENPNREGRFYTMFSTSLEDVLSQCQELAHEANKSGSYTDTDRFSLSCGVCGERLRGEKEATAHAKTTGHTDFQEVVTST